MVRPKKYLGQHFLTDPSIARRITDALALDDSPVVIEIGPGTGVLTGELLQKPGIKLIPVEIDHESVEYLKNKWPALADSIVETDILKFDPGTLTGQPLNIIGNFPYNISSQIFFRLLDYKNQIKQIVCMLQKEVAERLVSSPGNKEYGILSVLLQAWFDTEFLFSVKPGSFFPPPKVNSAVIRLKRNNTVNLPCDENLFRSVVKTTFNQRRKMIRNSIRPILSSPLPDYELLSLRPEQLGVPEFIALTNWISEQLRTNNPGC